MEHFVPKLPDVYGAMLGYISEEDSDEEPDMMEGTNCENMECVLPDKCTISVDQDPEDKDESGLEITACILPNRDHDSSSSSLSSLSSRKPAPGVQITSFVLPNGRIDLAEDTTDPYPEMPSLQILACVLPNGRIDLINSQTAITCDSSPSATPNQKDCKNHKSLGSRSSKDCMHTKSRSLSGSSSLEDDDDKKPTSMRGKISGESQTGNKGIKDGSKNTSGNSGDVILLEDDDCTTKKSSTVVSPDKTTDHNDRLPPTCDSEATCDCSGEVGDACKNGPSNAVDGGKGAGDAIVMCTIDLTELDEEDEVYPSTSSHEPPLYGYHGQNLFSRFNHPALRQGMATLDDEDIEYSEKEVQCSDEECECGGKSKGGTHKYMVPRPKKVVNRPVTQPMNWAGESEGSDDENLLEQPAHVRTRKWIESQSLYMQRRNFLNSQPVPSSEVIVIDSDDEADGEAETTQTRSSDNKGQVEDKPCGVVDTISEQNNSKANVDETQTNGKDETARNSNEKQSNGKDEASSVLNREKDSLSAELSPTSCPTNLSVLAQASDPSLKNVVCNDVGNIVKMVNGEPSDHADTNELDSKAPTDGEDKDSAS
jgi:hypothetical protein